jgi:hypothetical protein
MLFDHTFSLFVMMDLFPSGSVDGGDDLLNHGGVGQLENTN